MIGGRGWECFALAVLIQQAGDGGIATGSSIACISACNDSGCRRLTLAGVMALAYHGITGKYLTV